MGDIVGGNDSNGMPHSDFIDEELQLESYRKRFSVLERLIAILDYQVFDDSGFLNNQTASLGRAKYIQELGKVNTGIQKIMQVRQKRREHDTLYTVKSPNFLSTSTFDRKIQKDGTRAPVSIRIG